MGNGIESSPDLDGTTPLELALDRATEQYMAAQQERQGRRRLPARTSTTTAIVVDGPTSALPARLSWKGIEVTEEFQQYASRVARGEQLAPYRGQVLARACPEFPWGAPQSESTGTEALPRFRSRAPRVAAWVFGVGALIMAGLGIGSGTAVPPDELAPFVMPPTTTALALRPGSRDDMPMDSLEDADLGIASAIESALAHAVPAPSQRRVGALPRASGPPALAGATPATKPSVPSAARAPESPATLARPAAASAMATLQPWNTSAASNGVTMSAGASRAPASGSNATATDPSHPSALFTDAPSF